MTALRFFMLLALVIWIGGIIFFAAVVAPALFTMLPSVHLAGLVVRHSLATLHWMGVICGAVFLTFSLWTSRNSGIGWQAAAPRNLLVAGMIVVTLISQLIVAAKMEVLQGQVGDIESVAVTDPRRLAFNSLHQWSTSLETVVLLLGLVALWFVARNWTVPLSTSGVAQNLSARSSSAFHS